MLSSTDDAAVGFGLLFAVFCALALDGTSSLTGTLPRTLEVYIGTLKHSAERKQEISAEDCHRSHAWDGPDGETGIA